MIVQAIARVKLLINEAPWCKTLGEVPHGYKSVRMTIFRGTYCNIAEDLIRQINMYYSLARRAILYYALYYCTNSRLLLVYSSQ